MRNRYLPITILLVTLGIICLFLSACGGKSQGVTSGIALELDAQEKNSGLTPEEVAALKTEGEIDKDLPSTAMSDVTKQYRYYLHKGRNHIKSTIRRCEKYLPYAKGVFEKEGMPKDLAYLAIVESGYNRSAISPAGAAGAWQFMRKTGSAYGLDQDTWTDERFDIYESTEAAATYLKRLYKEFQDWPTAIAAYNSGEGKMRRAMQQSGSRNFFEVRERNETLSAQAKLREETKQYVPRFLAIVKIMRNLALLKLPVLHQEKAIQVERVVAQPGTDLKSVAKALSIDWEEFCLLNKHHQGVVSSATRETYLYVPKDKAVKAKELLATAQQGEFTGWKTCKIDSAESWKNLERRYKISVEKLQAANPRCSLKTGEVIFLPGNAATVAIAKQAEGTLTPKSVGKKGEKGERLHTLQPKETLYGVAKKYAVRPADLLAYNAIEDPSRLRTGTVLRIPGKNNHPASGSSYGSLGSRQEPHAKSAPKSRYIVQSNDTMWKISRRYNVTVEQLKAWNNLHEDALHVGDALVVNAE